MPAKKETEREFQQREFPGKIENVERRTKEVLGKFSTASEGEKAKARKAKKAAGRVKRRLAGPAPAAKAKAKKGLFGSLWDIGRRAVGLPGEEKKRLKAIEKETSKVAKRSKE